MVVWRFSMCRCFEKDWKKVYTHAFIVIGLPVFWFYCRAVICLCVCSSSPPTLSLYPPTLLSHHLSPPSSPVCLCYVLVYSGWVTQSDVRQFSCEEVRAQLVLFLWFVGNKITTYCCRLMMTLVPSLEMFPQWKFSFDQHSGCPPNSSLLHLH